MAKCLFIYLSNWKTTYRDDKRPSKISKINRYCQNEKVHSTKLHFRSLWLKFCRCQNPKPDISSNIWGKRFISTILLLNLDNDNYLKVFTFFFSNWSLGHSMYYFRVWCPRRVYCDFAQTQADQALPQTPSKKTKKEWKKS